MVKNPVAKSLRSAHLSQKVVKAKKGKGSYSRKKPIDTDGDSR